MSEYGSIEVENYDQDTYRLDLPPLKGDKGEKGDKGDPGAAGAPGPAGQWYRHQQSEPAATWTVSHGLGMRPAVTLVLDEEPSRPVYTDVSYPDLNTVVIEWPEPCTGWAELS